MLLAAHIHDQTIARNVRELQDVCATLLGKLSESIDTLMRIDGERARARKLGAATDSPPGR